MRTLFLCLCLSHALLGQVRIAKIKYQGGDWYANKTSLPNLIAFCNRSIGTQLATEVDVIGFDSPKLFNYPWVHLTGHGNILLQDAEVKNLRKYLLAGGFLHIDDNYGLDPHIRREMKKVFPELDFVELPFDHPVYQKPFKFPKGLPKIHEHDGKPAQGFALIYRGRMLCFYSFESDLGNGWEDASVYQDPPEKRKQALEMGANLIYHTFLNP